MSLYLATDQYQIKCSGTVTLGTELDSSGLFHGGWQVATFTGTRSTHGITLTSHRRDEGSGHERIYACEIPALSYSHTATDTSDGVNLDFYIIIKDLEIRQNEDGHQWKLTFSSIELWVNGSLDDTISGTTLYSDVAGAWGIPLIGIKPTIELIQDASPTPPFPAAVSHDGGHDRSIYQTLDAGWRYLDEDGVTWVTETITSRVLNAPEQDGDCGDDEHCYDEFSNNVDTPVDSWDITAEFNLLNIEEREGPAPYSCPCPENCPGPNVTYDVSQDTVRTQVWTVSATAYTEGFDPATYKISAKNACGCPPDEPVEVSTDATRTRDAGEMLWDIDSSISWATETYAVQTGGGPCGPCGPPDGGGGD